MTKKIVFKLEGDPILLVPTEHSKQGLLDEISKYLDKIEVGTEIEIIVTKLEKEIGN